MQFKEFIHDSIAQAFAKSFQELSFGFVTNRVKKNLCVVPRTNQNGILLMIMTEVSLIEVEIPWWEVDYPIEAANFFATEKLVSFSKQQLVDYDHWYDPVEPGSCDSRCIGGLMWEKDNPNTDTYRGNCKFDKIAASVANFSIVSLDEDQIAGKIAFLQWLSMQC